MNKKGQFFLIAAVVIVGILVTLSAINIYTRAPVKEDTAFYDLSREINYESNKLIDYGVYKADISSEINKSINALISNYSAANPDTDMLFVYGNDKFLSSIFYNRTSSGFEGIGTGGGAGIGLEQSTTISSGITPTRASDNANNVSVNLGGEAPLNFVLQPGENFFIVLKKETEGETLVAQE